MCEFTALVSRQCISAELMESALGKNILITLGVVRFYDEKRMTSIGTVTSIGSDVTIEAGTRISRLATIGDGLVIEAGGIIETGAQVGNFVTMEANAAVRTGGTAQNGSYLCEEAEVSYDACLPANQKLEPGVILY